MDALDSWITIPLITLLLEDVQYFKPMLENDLRHCKHPANFKILQYNIKNIVIWPDDIRKILKFFPNNSISEIKLLFPDPWPKKKHRNRRLIQNEFIKTIYPIIKHKGTKTISTDHDLLKKWVLEKFQNYTEFEWLVKGPNDWRLRPNDCFQTKYELKSINQQRNPCWFVFKKK